jgi:hypothetical protein
MVCWTIFDADIEAKTAIYPAALESIIMAIFNDFELDMRPVHETSTAPAGGRPWCGVHPKPGHH